MISAPQHPLLTSRLRSLLERAVSRASHRDSPLLASLTVETPVAERLGLLNQAGFAERILWEQPSRRISILGLGAAARFSAGGHDRFSDLSNHWRDASENSLSDAAPNFPFAAPVSLGGFAFDASGSHDDFWRPYPEALLIVPRFLFVQRESASWLSISVRVTPESSSALLLDEVLSDLKPLLQPREPDPEEARAASGLSIEDDTPPEAWKGLVSELVRDIGQGTAQKVVLARRLEISLPGGISPTHVLRRLRSAYERCTLFSFGLGQSTFLGASPERLVRLDGRTVRVDCLAGSRPRGDDEEEDIRLGAELLSNEKELNEQGLVVRAVKEALVPVCSSLQAPASPGLLRMPNVQHLHTPVEGLLASEGNALELAGLLQPTPACGGYPRDAALALIRRYEPFDRGWYAGGAGWTDAKGSGEFTVAIRSGVVRGDKAVLYAGCGILPGSDPEREYRESCLKLRPMLWALDSRT